MPNKWDGDQRLVLHVINSLKLSLTNAQRASLFNHVFADHLKSCGYKNGVEFGVSSSQYADMPRYPDKWVEVARACQEENQQVSRDHAYARIRGAGEQLAIDTPTTNWPLDQVIIAEPGRPTGSAAKRGAKALVSKGAKRMKVGERVFAGEDDVESAENMVEDDVESTSKTAKRKKGAERVVAGEDDVEGAPTTSQGSEGTKVAERVVAREDDVKSTDNMPEEDAESETTPPPEQLGDFLISGLAMIHYKDIRWDGNQALLDDEVFMGFESLVYAYGGQVHKVPMPDGQTQYDCMICDPLICRGCHGFQKHHGEQSSSLPFVHASDTTRKDGKLVFEPKPKAHAAMPQQHTWRRILFQTFDGAVTLTAAVCTYSGCAVCSGSEHIRVQENKELDMVDAADK